MMVPIENFLDSSAFLSYGETHDQRIAKLLRTVSDEDLALIHAQLMEEQNHRLIEAEKKVESLRKTFARLENPPPASVIPKSTESNPTKTRRSKKTKANKTNRAPRGKSRELLLALLEDGATCRKQLEERFEEKGMSATSVSTLLNRLKNEKLIVHDKENKLYSKNSGGQENGSAISSDAITK